MHKKIFVSVSVFINPDLFFTFDVRWNSWNLGTFKSNLLFLSQFTIQETNPWSQFKTNVHTEQKKIRWMLMQLSPARYYAITPPGPFHKLYWKKQTNKHHTGMVKYKGPKRHSQSLLCKPAIPFGNDYQVAQNKIEQLPQHSTFQCSTL